MNLYLRGGGSQISTTLDSVTERGVLCEFFWVQTVFNSAKYIPFL